MKHLSVKDALTHISSVIVMIILIRIIGRIIISLLVDIKWDSFVSYIAQTYSSAFILFLVCGIIFGFLSGYARVYNLQENIFFREYIIIAILGFLGSMAGDFIYLTLDYTKSYIQVLPGDLPLIFIQLYPSILYFALLFFVGSVSCTIFSKYPKWLLLKE